MQPLKPSTGLAGLKQHFRADVISGFLVFLIALPLCLAIAKASGFPPVGGILTAVIGGVLVTFLGGSELTIKGPAAGLIVIAAGCVQELGKEFAGPGQDPTIVGYHLALAVVVVAGVLQVVFGLVRSGVLGDFFPSAAVHGMLASIGITIILKQVFPLFGATAPQGGAFALMKGIPGAVTGDNPDVAIIGLLSLAILFVLPLIKNKYVKMIPAPMVVLLVAVPLGRYFDLGHEHSYLFLDHHNYTLGPKFLVSLPSDLRQAIQFPDFSHVFAGTSLKFIVMFALVGSLESLLSTKAVDTLDPYQRKSNLNRDLVGVGVGNTLAGLLGGLPMISEIVRSSANVNNGGQTRWANFFHGLFLLAFVVLLPGLIHQIPLAALAAMLVYTGFRLASPKEFVHTYHVGKEQLLIFVVTIVTTLATDLLVGIAAGILVKFIVHFINGGKSLPVSNIFKADVVLEPDHGGDNFYRLHVRKAAVFSNYLSLKEKLDELPRQQRIAIDFSEAKLVDHTMLENLKRYQADYLAEGGGAQFELQGLDNHQSLSAYPTAARVQKSAV